MEDAALVERAAAGDEVAFEAMVRRHTDAVWRLARANLRDDFAAEEAVQDTFVKAHRALAGFRGDASVRTWLLAICQRTCIDISRRKRPTVVSLDEARRARAREEQPELTVALDQAMGRLSDDERRAFTLVDVLGYSREEAAQIVGVPPSTMRSRVAKARLRLMDALGDAPSESTR
ncbi:MAG TPA: sigma-70 family RNA polymerase sigma factor [Acidimicrobiales bacterium]|nr:sigma-70 family RNA polymerase sigma factor [Acidimicrobiales bacterium]